MESRSWMRLGGWCILFALAAPFIVSGILGAVGYNPGGNVAGGILAGTTGGAFLLGVILVVYGYVRRGSEPLAPVPAEEGE